MNVELGKKKPVTHEVRANQGLVEKGWNTIKSDRFWFEKKRKKKKWRLPGRIRGGRPDWALRRGGRRRRLRRKFRPTPPTPWCLRPSRLWQRRFAAPAATTQSARKKKIFNQEKKSRKRQRRCNIHNAKKSCAKRVDSETIFLSKKKTPTKWPMAKKIWKIEDELWEEPKSESRSLIGWGCDGGAGGERKSTNRKGVSRATAKRRLAIGYATQRWQQYSKNHKNPVRPSKNPVKTQYNPVKLGKTSVKLSKMPSNPVKTR